MRPYNNSLLRQTRSRHFPILTVATLTATAAVTATRLWTSDVMHALWRNPDALGSGQVWRLLTPVLVQSDSSALVVVAVLALCAVIGVIGERVFPPRRWIALYLIGALVGHGIGEAFQPEGGGTSVAFMGILGGLAAYALQPGARVPTPIRVEAALAIPLAALDTALEDIHGLPFLAGLVVAWFWQRRDRRISLGREAPRAPSATQSGYSSFRRMLDGSSDCGLAVRSSRNEWYGATNGSGAITW